MLLAQRAELWKQIQIVTDRIKEVKSRYEKNASGLEIGCIITDKKGNVYKIVEIEFWDMDMVAHTIKAHPQKKDGSFSTTIRNLWKVSDEIKVVKS